MPVPFLDLPAQHAPLHDAILAAWSRILHSARFVSGAEVAAFEEEWAAATGARHCVAVASGTDALLLALRALGVGPQARGAVPANTFVATAEAVSLAGGQPLFVDVDEATANLLPDAVADACAQGADVVLPVHLYGQPVDVDGIVRAAGDVPVVFDAAQAHLAEVRGEPIGGRGAASTYSFYPGKNLGAPGEGGAVTTDDDGLADTLRMLRDHGQREKYRSELIGQNARMSELEAAALRIKLPHLAEWTERRRWAADRYAQHLKDEPAIQLPHEPEWARGVYHLFVVRVPHRDRVTAALADRGIGTGLHYPVPLHLQPAYEWLGHRPGDFPVSERRADSLLSLPMSAEITAEQIDEVCDALRAVVESLRAA